MAEKSNGAIIELEGVLGEVLPTVFRSRLPQLLDTHRNRRVRMVVTTQAGQPLHTIAAPVSLFRPARDGRPAEFTWCAADFFHAVIRQFRLDFLRLLGPDELRAEVGLGIYFDFAAEHGAASENESSTDEPTFSASVTPPPPAESPMLVENGHPTERALTTFPVAAPLAAAIAVSPAASATLMPPVPPQPIINAPPPPTRPAHPPFTGAGSRSLPGNFYQDFFGLELMPFNNTPDTQFYFPTPKHQEALSRLIYAISERKGFVMISGEIGAGKSTLCRALLTQLPREVKTALITHTHIEADQIVQAIAEDLGLVTSGRNRYEILQMLNEFLVEQLAAGCTVCIIIDEAQNLSPAALEEVRMISNLETEQEKLVQLILLGQPDLRDKVRLPELRQLRQRISVQFHLEPLDRAETLGYIRHRLKIANPAQPLRFGARAMGEAFRYSGGVPRLINSICDNALLTAFARQQRAITARLIRESARDLDLDPQYAGLGQYFRFW